MIKTLSVYLGTPQNAEQFCKIVSRFDGNFDLRHGNREVDAKSILGVLTLPLVQNTLLYGDISEKMETDLQAFAGKEENYG